MNDQQILDELLALLEARGITIRSEPLGGGAGGFCSVKGQNIFFVDTQSTAAETAALAAEIIPKLIDIESIYIRPEVRQFIENHSPIEKDSQNGT